MNRTVLAIIALLIGSPATAATIPVSMLQEDLVNPVDGFYTFSTTFTLPAGFSNAALTMTVFGADDRQVLQLNGSIVASTGLFGPGLGSMVLTLGGPNDPFTFQYGSYPQSAVFGPFAPITSGFLPGLNTLTIVANNTNNGIQGGLSTNGPTGAGMTGVISYDAAVAVPVPAALPVFASGLGLLAWASRRKRRTAVA